MDSIYSTIYHQPWWLDIASGGLAREVVSSSGGLVVGRLPYVPIPGRLGMNGLGIPRLTHVLGPSLAPQFGGDNFPRSLKQLTILGDLIQQLPRAHYVRFRLHGGIFNTLAFETAGFLSSVEYTIEIDPAPPDVAWKRLRDKTRNVIRRARDDLSISELTDPKTAPERFSDFYESNLREKQIRNEYEPVQVQRLIEQCLLRNCGRVLAAVDAAGELHAAIFTIWDEHSEYYFMSTRTPRSANGAVSMLLWEAIQHAAQLGLRFDMDNLHVVDGELPNLLLLTGFGGRLAPRYVVKRCSQMVQLAQWARGLPRHKSV